MANGIQMAVLSFILVIGLIHTHSSVGAPHFFCAIKGQIVKNSTGVNLKAGTLHHGEV